MIHEIYSLYYGINRTNLWVTINYFIFIFYRLEFGFLEEIPSVTVEALRWNEDMESEALSGVVVMKDYGWDLVKAIDSLRYWNPRSLKMCAVKLDGTKEFWCGLVIRVSDLRWRRWWEAVVTRRPRDTCPSTSRMATRVPAVQRNELRGGVGYYTCKLGFSNVGFRPNWRTSCNLGSGLFLGFCNLYWALAFFIY